MGTFSTSLVWPHAGVPERIPMARFLKSSLVVLAVALVYTLLHLFNELLFARLRFSAGVEWVFLPSGLRLLAVLLLAARGALGVALASACVGLLRVFPDDPITCIGAGVVSGLAPWLACRGATRALRVREDLAGLGAADLLKLTLAFALVSAILHQLWYVARGHSDSLLQGIAAMVVGDILGALIVLYAARLVLGVLPRLVR